MTIPIVRQAYLDQANDRYIFTCMQSRLRWRIPAAVLRDDRRIARTWSGMREANWQIGLHGQAVSHAVLSLTEH